MPAQQFVQALQAIVALRNADVQQPGPIAELDPRRRPHAITLRIAHEVGDPRRAMDVGERERAHAGLRRFLQQRLGLHHAVLEAEPAMAIQEHLIR